MSALEIQKGERGQWPKRKTNRTDRSNGTDRTKRTDWAVMGRRKVIRKAAAAAAALRLAGFVAWSEPRDDDEQENP